MDTFRTELNLPPSDQPIGHKSFLLTVGSCFSDTLGKKLEESKFQVTINPFGTLYNPLSIHKAIRYALNNQAPDNESYIHSQGLYYHYDFHSAFSSEQEDDLSTLIASRIGSVHNQLTHTDYLFITYGTAFVYRRRDTGEIVANCHKVPQAHFSKELMSVDQIVSSFTELHKQLREFNPSLKIILTLSPVRHLKDTLELNSVSKSILRAACHELSLGLENVDYFPAYEILIDDLRDYRFYSSDMIHPSGTAVDYIWKQFGKKYFDADTVAILEKWQSIKSAIKHRPFHPNSPSHQTFLKNTLLRLQEINRYMNVEDEIQLITDQTDVSKEPTR